MPVLPLMADLFILLFFLRQIKLFQLHVSYGTQQLGSKPLPDKKTLTFKNSASISRYRFLMLLKPNKVPNKNQQE